MDIKNVAITAKVVIESLISLLENENVDVSSIKFKVGSASEGYESPDMEFGKLIDLALKGLEEAKTQVPEGFVLVPKENITHFYQDNDEPENCCLDASGFDSLGDCINDGEVMLVNKFTQANISKQQMFGAWCACDPKPLTRFIKEFKLFDTQEEAEKAMIEAQEPAND